MMKVNAIKFAVVALVASVAACSDSVAPHDVTAPDAVPALAGGVTTELTTNDTVRFTITIDPRYTTYYNLGAGNSLTFPAGSICDPTKSTYGVGEWDKPCTAARTPVSETVTAWLDAQGHPQVDFSTDLRFVPSALPTGWVTLTFADYQASLDPMFNILYCRNAHATCIDESISDPSLITVRDPVTGNLTRRLKHFSGYLVGAGDDNARNVVPVLLKPMMTTASRSARQRSGYILASGN